MVSGVIKYVSRDNRTREFRYAAYI
jgi:hypothetical protein